MIHIERILCPIGASGGSLSALSVAAGLAEWYDARVDALHAVPGAASPEHVPARSGVSHGDHAVADSPAMDRVRALIGSLTTGADRITPTIAGGSVVPAILDASARCAADLIVMGRTHAAATRRYPRPPLIEAVIRRATQPVLAVPPGAGLGGDRRSVPFAHIVCAIDFSPASSHALQYALRMAQEWQSTVSLLHVLDPAPDRFGEPPSALVHVAWLYLRDALREQLRGEVPEEARLWCETSEVLALGSPGEEIPAAAADLEADLLVMGVRTGRFRGTRRSTIGEVVMRAACPVLAVPETVGATAAAPAQHRAAVPHQEVAGS